MCVVLEACCQQTAEVTDYRGCCDRKCLWLKPLVLQGHTVHSCGTPCGWDEHLELYVLTMCAKTRRNSTPAAMVCGKVTRLLAAAAAAVPTSSSVP